MSKTTTLSHVAPRWIDLAGALTVLALGAAFYFFVVEPALQRKDDLAARRDELQTKRAELDRATGLLAVVQRRRSDVFEAVQQSPLRLQSALHTNRRLGEIGDLASQCDLKVNEIQPHGVQKGAKVDLVPVRLAGRGSFANCLRFLRAVREKFLDVGVLSVALEGNPSDRSPTASFEFRLKWHTTPGESLAAHTGGRVGP